MSVVVIAVATESGVPIFSRKRGSNENVQFSTIASLHGINMFSKCHNLSMIETAVDNGAILWKEYCKSVTLIGIATGGLECDLELLLSSVHDAMIFCIGKKELENLKNIDQVKRDLRQCYPILDYLLESLDPNALSSPLPTLVLDLIQSILCPQAQQLQVAFRAVTCKLLADVYILVVCGATPALTQIDEIVLQCWEVYAPIIKEAKFTHPRNFPMSMTFEPSVLGILIVNINKRRGVFSRHLHASNTKGRGMSGAHRIDILRTFYVTSARDLAPELKHKDANNKDSNEHSLCMTETYWCSEYHKCHAQRSGNILCCALYSSSVQLHTIRLITSQILQDLSSNKDVCW
ncbi:fuzzy planar cell polarity protein-like protein isoform X2 [Anticarsia gemmatalis]|uniref:fuzzy planar cell polarity protein-like protein isoform X2 n=1 Tax=Anticarsia gemmatalis TaxID=129554 RepID=UPI003F75BEEE